MKHIEDDHQKMLIHWASLVKMRNTPHTIGSHLIHVPNGGNRNIREAARLKAAGVRAGFPDLFLFVKNANYSGLAIELKRPRVSGKQKPKTTDKQKEWLERLSHAGYCAVVCYGFDDAKDTICRYLTLNESRLLDDPLVYNRNSFKKG